MIITVTPNPAWDVTYTLPDVRSSDVHQIDRVSEQAVAIGLAEAVDAAAQVESLAEAMPR